MAPPVDVAARYLDDIAAIRERLARLEGGVASIGTAADERHRQVLAALDALTRRQEQVEARWWKLSLALTALGLGGGAAASSVLRSLLGG